MAPEIPTQNRSSGFSTSRSCWTCYLEMDTIFVNNQDPDCQVVRHWWLIIMHWPSKSHERVELHTLRMKKLTFWSAFSFSSKFLVAVSSFVWVSLNSFSNWTIFFSRASTSSLAFGQVPKLSKAQEVGWMWKGEKDTNQFGGKNHLRFEGLSLSPRASGWRSWASLGSDRGRSRAVASSFEDRGPPPQPWKISQKISITFFLKSPIRPC